MLPSTINIFEKAAKKAGRILVRDFGEIENLQINPHGDTLATVDKSSEVYKMLVDAIK